MAGQPTKYNDSIPLAVTQYLDLATGREQTELPTIEGLAGFLNVDTDTIVEWGKIHPLFSVTIKKLKAKQKNQLINDGLYGGKEVNSIMAIFLLKVNHGMIETSHTDVTSQGEKIGMVIYKPEKNAEWDLQYKQP